jgi:hypothetical protein
MNQSFDIEVLIKTFQDLPIGIGIFKVHDLNDLKSIQYVYMNNVILYEMRKTSEEVVGKRIIEVAPEAYEHEVARFVIVDLIRHPFPLIQNHFLRRLTDQ